MGLLDKENLSVFAFMENASENGVESPDEDLSSRSPQSSPSPSTPPRLVDVPQRSPRYSDLEVRAIQDGVQRAWGRASLHSDSGISVRSHSPDEDSPTTKDKLLLDTKTPLIEESIWENDDPEPNALQVSPHLEAHSDGFGHRYWPSVDTSHSSGPEAYQISPPPLAMHRPISYDETMPERNTRPTTSLVHLKSRQGSSSSRPAKSGYDLLASNISSHDDTFLKPIYRKFEILNNRMLLYLQDEIAQMEEDLKELDAAIAIEDMDVGRRGPSSRRSEAKLPSQLQWHRLDLLGRCFAKVEQYSRFPANAVTIRRAILTSSFSDRALTSYSNLTKSLDPASHADISIYRQWISDHTPIAEQEAAFLNKPADLLTVPNLPYEKASGSSPSASPSSSPLPPTQTVASPSRKELEMSVMVVCFSLISTIIVFKVVSRLLPRLVISLLVGLAALTILQPDALTSLNKLRNSKTSVAVYCTVMLALSIVVT